MQVLHIPVIQLNKIMDFPEVLETMKWAEGIDEKNQEIDLVLSQRIGTILHNTLMGTTLSNHVPFSPTVIAPISKSLEQIRDITVQSITIDQDQESVLIIYSYNGRTLRYNYSYN